LVIGGGNTARFYIKLGRTLNFSEKILDEIGISITRINAKLLTHIIKETNEKIPISTDDAKNMNEPIVIMGGTTPGHSTDMVGAELAEKTNAELFIIATNVDGVYDKDPNLHSDAILYEKISIDQLIKEYGVEWKKAGKNTVIDGPALEIINRSKITTFVLNGKNLDQLKNAVNNKQFYGTKITS
jgi:uridylate kinase